MHFRHLNLKEIEKKLKSKLYVIFRFSLAYVGWECDSDGEVVEDKNGKRYLILTNHASPYIGVKEELLAKINEYEHLIKETKKAIELL